MTQAPEPFILSATKRLERIVHERLNHDARLMCSGRLCHTKEG